MENIFEMLFEFLTNIETPLFTLLGGLTSYFISKKMSEIQYKQSLHELEIGHRNEINKMEKENEIGIYNEKMKRKADNMKDKLLNIYYPIIHFYDVEDLELEKSGNYNIDGLYTSDYHSIKAIIEDKNNILLVNQELRNSFTIAESEWIETIKEDKNSYGGFDTSGSFENLIKTKIKESEAFLEIN
ncbi:hypothetical protein [Carnobacterium maltaromaticum]|uniref:hypothetical protein n=1 Tax=Carnobacterium maltaromaticum TaxID=2751 RepID=UPI0039AE98B8